MSSSRMQGSKHYIFESAIFSSIYRSSVVEKVLLSAYKQGKRFSVIVVDSRPLLEGTLRLEYSVFSKLSMSQAKLSCRP